jgi:dolichyl-phosphate beta-glucosyltransferase
VGRPWLSVVIPAYNEAERLPGSLDRLVGYFRSRGASFEILVADDGSDDRTADKVDGRAEPEIRVLRLPHRGKGAAVREGVAASRGDLVLLTDADLSIPIEEIGRFEAKIANGFALVCGSRGLAQSRALVKPPLLRKRMGETFNWIVRSLRLSPFRDTQCGFKLIQGEVARALLERTRVRGFAWDVELLLLARRAGYRAAEVPVAWGHVPESRVHPLKDAARMLIDVVLIRLRSWL